MTQVKTSRIQPGYEPIKGYVLEKKIGSGGYGEVWRAEAPGGLKKAVKFVFGQHDERRASQELKSLERIKAVQHPFILTLERFELIENQLVIVTELADGSLEDIYTQHRKRGSCGIPRESLLGYMQDAADALDYLHELYRLQHLDIKPANLLMVGGRVKVADFGLLKDLGDVDCSLVGGLTPIYAPPEVFDGRPSMHSDQYSLAVMYQELLTSTRPFGGRTIAQLATQHVHNAPNLNPLPGQDRPAVAKALEKAPNRRFETCSEFIAKLRHPHGQQAITVGPEQDESAKPEHDVENLPELTGGRSDVPGTVQTQVLVVALGGTGADCLHQLRSRTLELGGASPVVLHSVLIDTDPLATQTALMVDATASMLKTRVVSAVLRSPKEYRESGTDRLRTISRRWIYNVPRNRQTSGMRPLGRLALVDHGRDLMRVLSDAVEALKDSLAENQTPKIYVVGSLTGGTGGGMYVDVAYLLRHLLDEQAMENQNFLSMLTTNRFQGDPSRPLALHATKSALKELAHFLEPGNSYPGDPGAGWPSVPAARTPLHQAYVIAASGAPGASSPIESVVDYLWCDATVCGEWFEKGRQQDDGNNQSGSSKLRAMSVVQIGDPGERQSTLLAPHSTMTLLLRWLGDPRSSQDAADTFLRRVQRRCYLDANSLRRQAEQWMGHSQQERRNLLMEQLHTMDPAAIGDHRKVQSQLMRWLTNAMDLEQAEVLAGQIAKQIQRELSSRLQDSRLDLSSAIAGLKRVRAYARELHGELIDRSQADFDELLQVTGATEETTSRRPSPLATLRHACDQGERMIEVVAGRVGAAVATALDDPLEAIIERFSDGSARVAQCIQKLQTDLAGTSDPWELVAPDVTNKLPAVLQNLHGRLVSTHLFHIVGAPAAIDPESLVSQLNQTAATEIRAHIESENARVAMQGDTESDSDSELRDMSGTAALDSTASLPSNTDVLCATRSGGSSIGGEALRMTQTISWSKPEAAPIVTAESAMQAVKIPLLECGGKQRLFLVCRDELERKRLIPLICGSENLPITTITARTSVPMLIQEAQGIELKHAIAWLDSLTGDDGQISGRLTTRCDIEWK